MLTSLRRLHVAVLAAAVLVVATACGGAQEHAAGGSASLRPTGTGAFEGLRGSGEMEGVYDPNDDSLVHETLTGSTRDHWTRSSAER